jgi:hypothetical protein
MLHTYFNLKGFPSSGLFFRPDSGKKFFSPRVVFADEFASFEQEVAHYCLPHQLIGFCLPKIIDAEYRVLFVDGKAITGSRYHLMNKLDIDPFCPPEVLNFAESMGVHMANKCPYVVPDGVCFVDVGVQLRDYTMDSNILSVVEFSAFGCAGLYACDVNKVVESVSANALRCFNLQQPLRRPCD